MSASIFETDRLRFRVFTEDDLDALARINADEETSRYVGDGTPLSRAETRQWIENSRRNVARYGYGTGAVVERQSGALIGWAGVARPADGSEEIIYGFDRNCWGMGYGTELLGGLMEWAQHVLGIRELRATVYADNAASIAMLRRRGFNLADDCYQGDPDTHLYVARL